MTTSTYQPKPGSIAWKVIEFLTINPDEELTVQDVGAKFDCQPLAVHSHLGPAVKAGVLVRVEAPYGELVYRLGAGSKAIRSAPALDTASNDAEPGAKRPARKQRRVIVDLDVDALVPRDDVPLPPRWKPIGDKLDRLIAPMKVGQSYVLPLEAMVSLKAACYRLNKETSRKLTVRRVNDKEVGVWRLS